MSFTKAYLILFALVLLALVLFIRSVVKMPGKSYNGAFQALSAEEKTVQTHLEKHVDVLAREIGIRHCLDPQAYAALGKTADYIRLVWEKQGYSVNVQEFEAYGHKVRNLFVEKKGTGRPDEILVVGAHYDGVEECPAANDNGSGVAALLELSRLSAEKTFTRTVQFVAFVNEELFQAPEMGSRAYASQMGADGKNVIGMISLETIGFYSDGKGSQKYPWPFSWFYPDRGNFITFVGNYGSRSFVRQCVKAFRQECPFPSEGVAAPGFIQGIGWSDHWSFWQEGYPGLMVTDTAPFRYKYYHKAEDTPDKIDFIRLSRVVSGLQRTLEHLAK